MTELSQIAEQSREESPAVDESQYEDYFGFAAEERFYLPDGKQYIDFRLMNEGARRKYQKKTNSDIKINRRDESASVRADPAEDRKALLEESVTGWHLMRRGPNGWYEVPFSMGEFQKWMSIANPKIIDDLELAIRKANPWMQADMSTEEIDKEIERLYDLRKQAEEQQAKKSASVS